MKNTMIEYDPISIRWMGYHTALKGFFDDIAGLPDIPKNDKNEDGKNLKTVYATPSSAFTKYVIPMVNGLTQNPILTFYLSSEEIENNVSGNAITTYNFYDNKNGNSTKISFTRPVIKKLTYTCNLFTTKMVDCDYILTLLECNCNRYKPFSTKVNGRPAQFYLDNIGSGLPVEYEDKKFIRAQFTVSVPTAIIMPAEIDTDDAIIKRILMYLNGEEDIIVPK